MVALAAVAAAQESRLVSFVPLGELLQPEVDHAPWLAAFEGGYSEGYHLRGEHGLASGGDAPDQPRRWPAWYSRGELASVLGTLLNVPSGSFSFARGGAFVGVDRAEAARVREVVDALLQRLPPRVRIDVRLARERDGRREVVLAQQVECRAGRTAVASAVVATTALVDFEVEIAQAASSGNPVVMPTPHGAMVAVRPFVTPGGGDAVLEVLTRTVDPLPSEPFDTEHPSFGAIARVRQRVGEAASVGRVHLGGDWRQSWQGPDGARWELLLRCDWKVPPPARPGGRTVEYAQPLPALAGFASERELPALLEQDGERLGLQGASWDESDAMSAGEGGARVAFDTAAGELAAKAGALLDSVRVGGPVSIEVFDVAAGQGPGSNDARRLGAAELTPADDTDALVQVLDGEDYVRDWDVEVAQSSRMPDPKTGRVHSGLSLQLRRSQDRLTIRGEFSWRAPSTFVRTRMSQAMVARSGSTEPDGRSQPREADVLLPADSVAIESPVRMLVPIRVQAALRPGTETEARIGAALLGPDRELLIRVRAAE